MAEHGKPADASPPPDKDDRLLDMLREVADQDPTATRDAELRPRRPNFSIAGYQILREVGRGGQGTVYQALQESTKRKVAVKVLLAAPYASHNAQRRFEREVELAAQLKHPNIIAVFHSGTTPEGYPYYVMDYVRGLSLNHHVSRRKLSLKQTLDLFARVCDAVQYAHQRGVIHRDLKPSNVLVDAEGQPRLLDFGLAKLLSAPLGTLISQSDAVVGTLPYLSPEQARGNPDEIDTRTDIYALGVILYHILTGHFPYPVEGEIPEVLRHITETQPTPPTSRWTPHSGVVGRSERGLRPSSCPIGDEVQTIVLKALSKDRARRYQTAGDLARDLRHYLANEPIEAKRDSGWYVMRVILRRHWRRIGVLAAVAVPLFGCAALVYGQFRERQRLSRVREAARRLVDRAKTELRQDADIEVLVSSLEREVEQLDLAFTDLAAAEERMKRVDGKVSHGRDLAERQRYEDAIAKFNDALELDPGDYRALAGKAFTIFRQYLASDYDQDWTDRLEEAAELCRRALAVQDNHSVRNLLGTLLYQLGRLEEAEAQLQQALESVPQDKRDYEVFIYDNLSRVRLLQGRFDQALADARRGMDLALEVGVEGNAYENVIRTLGTIQLALGDDSGLEALQRAVTFDKKDPRNRLELARHLLSGTELEVQRAFGEAQFAEVLLDRREPRLDRVLAQALLRHGLPQEAAIRAGKALEGGDEPAYAHAILASASAQLKDVDRAREHLQAARQSPPAFAAVEGHPHLQVVVTCEKGVLWLDTAAELEALLSEAELAIDRAP